MHFRVQLVIGALAAMPAVGLSGAAFAHSNEPRTAVKFDEVGSCHVTVDRAVEPSLNIGYTIPMEDLPNPEHDLPDAKTHQFIAVCRDWSTRTPPPDYLAVDDLQRSIDIGYEEPERINDPEATFETSVEWAGCWRRITTEADRLPLTPEAATGGVDWDTTGFDAGVWYPVGHTFDPPWNVWRRAPFAVRIEDDVNDAIDAPAVIIDTPPKVIEHDETVIISGCAAAVGPVSVSLRYASESDPSGWRTLDQYQSEDADPAISFELSAPEETWGKSLLVAMDLVDGEGRAVEAFSPTEIIVLAPTPETPENPFPEPPEDPPSTGCQVVSPRDATPALWSVLVMLPLLRPRRANTTVKE